MTPPTATLMWFHGDGWVTGSLNLAHAVARALCARAGIAVLSVDYALAPEYPWTAGCDDVIIAVTWAAHHKQDLGGEGPLLVGGDRAGGNLAATAALAYSEVIDGQMLLHPLVDLQAGDETYMFSRCI